LIDTIWKGLEERSYPLHRFCTLMRKMNAKSFLQEKLILNQELSEEKEMADKYFGGEVELDAIRLTFFCSPPDFLKWDAPKKTFEKYILGYAVIITLKFPKKHHSSYLIEAVVVLLRLYFLWRIMRRLSSR